MKISQVALQLYTLRDHLKTPEKIRESMKKVRAIGYTSVEAAGLGPISNSDFLQILKGEGLTLCATHEDGAMIRKTPEKVVEKLKELGCRHTSYPYPADVDWSKPAEVESLVRDLDHAGAVLRAAGQVLSYHNHAGEFAPFAGTTVLDYIYAHTDAKNLQAELDTYWVQLGGANPVTWCKKMKGRLPLLHIKDYTVLLNGKPDVTSIGAGNLDWKEILPAAEASGTQWFIVEQDETPGDPFEAVKSSFDYIKANLVE